MKKSTRYIGSSSLVLLSSNAMAAVPTEASDAVTQLITDATAFIAGFWPLAIAVTVGLLWFKIFKKGTSRAT